MRQLWDWKNCPKCAAISFVALHWSDVEGRRRAGTCRSINKTKFPPAFITGTQYMRSRDRLPTRALPGRCERPRQSLARFCLCRSIRACWSRRRSASLRVYVHSLAVDKLALRHDASSWSHSPQIDVHDHTAPFLSNRAMCGQPAVMYCS
jgi:ribosomal protein S27AE